MIKKAIYLLAVSVFLLILGCDGSSDTIVLGGYVLLGDDMPVQGVKVTFVWPAWLGDWEAIEITDETGWYRYKSEDQFPENSVTITPSHPDYDFLPAAYSLKDVNDGSMLDLDFIAIPK